MKILLSNYSSGHSTESIYLNTAFNAAGCESTLWPNGISTFDIFDIVKPDIHITHHSKLSKDLVIYLQQSKNIDLIVNITGINQTFLDEVESTLSEYNIIPKLYFNNMYDHGLQSKKANIMTLPYGTDIFLGQAKRAYEIEYGILINDSNQLSPIGETYHYLTTKEDLGKVADICLPTHQMVQLFGNYNYIVFKYFNKLIPQIFYDAAYYNNNVFFDIEDRTELDKMLSKILGDGQHCYLDNKNSGNIVDNIKKKHTCLHRAKSLLSQFSCKNELEQLQSIIDRIL